MTRPTRRQLRAAFKEKSMLAGAIKLYGPVGKSHSPHYRRIRDLMILYDMTNPAWHKGPYVDQAPEGKYAVRSFSQTPRGVIRQAQRDAMIPPCPGQWPVVAKK
jgi:hypothetical protein